MTTVSKDSPSILHVDLDAFFASVEQRENPELRGLPVVVGGLGGRGVVAAASYEARKFGIRSAMSMAQAKQACPTAIFLAPRFDLYSEASHAVMEILGGFTPLVEPLSMDEAFLDVSGARRTLGDGLEIGQLLRARITATVGLTASVGIATSKSLAKIASEDAKPDGILVIEPGHEIEYLHALGVERLWGVGPVTREQLTKLGIITIGDLASRSLDETISILGPSQGNHLYRLAWNQDDREVVPNNSQKSISHEETFSVDISDRKLLEGKVRRLSDRVGERLRSQEAATRTITLKIRSHDFRTITRSRTLDQTTDRSFEIAQAAQRLLKTVDIGGGVRLIGVGAQIAVSDQGIQESLAFDGPPRGHLEVTLDAVRDRFGPGAVVSARDAVDSPDQAPKKRTKGGSKKTR